MADNTIDNLIIQVNANAEEASRIFDRLASNVGKVKGAASGAARGMRDLGEAAKDMGMATARSAEQSGESVQQLARNIDNVNKKRYSAAGAGAFAYLKKDSEVLSMKLDDAKARLADLLNADTPNNRAIANTTAEVKRLQDALIKAKKSEEGFGQSAKKAGKDAKEGSSGLKLFWESLKRIAFYRIVRSVIREITDAFKAGISNMYQWSKAIDGHFAKSMDRLATSTLYLKNGLGSLVGPIIESLVPAIDLMIDKFVEGINLVNQFIAAIKGEDTYTAAKKYATVWDEEAKKASSSVKKSANDIKRTILGFDELNILQKPNDNNSGSSSKNKKPALDYSKMFEERPLTGALSKLSNVTQGWPDWLKWLLGIGGVVGGAALLKSLPGLLGKLLQSLLDLIHIKLPQWLIDLFGGKKVKDQKIKATVDLVKGDWKILDKLKDASTYVKVGLQHWGWNNIEDWIGHAVTVNVALRKWGWTSLPEWIGANKGVFVNVGLFHWGWTTLIDWIGSAVTVSVALKKWGWKDLNKWIGDSVYVKVGLLHWGWDNIEDWIGRAVTVNVALKKWGWTSLGSWTKADDGLFVRIGLLHWGWTTISDWIGTAVTVHVGLSRWGWYSIQDYIGDRVDVGVHLFQGNFFTLQDWVGSWVDVEVYLVQGNFFTLQDWVGREVTVRVNLRMGSGGTINVGTGGSRSFGTATGNGGSTNGGGTGRQRRAIGGILNHGVWSNIPKYASGTSGAHGTMFVAGEAGPEIVGHIGGRTEILNKSQIASAMYSAVQAAMAPAAVNFAAAANYLQSGNNAFDMEMLAEMVRQGVESAIERQGDIQRQQLDTLRQINEKEFVAEVTTSSINNAQRRTNRRMGMTVVPVSQ